VAAPDDDDVLHAPDDVELAGAQQAQVARAAEGPRGARQVRLERGARRRLGPPVAVRDARAGDPDLADLAVAAPLPGRRVDDRDLLLGQGATAADELAPARGSVARRDRVSTQHVRAWPHARAAAAHDERALGEPVHRAERLAAEADRSEGGHE